MEEENDKMFPSEHDSNYYMRLIWDLPCHVQCSPAWIMDTPGIEVEAKL
jgi:hypothetical protein